MGIYHGWAGCISKAKNIADMENKFSSIFETFFIASGENPSRTAIIYKDQNEYKSITYHKLQNHAVVLGNYLLKQGIKKADRVAILFSNQPEWVISFLASQYFGAISVPIDIKLPPEDILKLIRASESRCVLCNEKISDILGKQKDFRVFKIDMQFLSGIDSPQMKDVANSYEKVDGSLPAAIFFTSGTTSNFKGVLLSHSNLLSNIKALHTVQRTIEDESFISILPLHHTYSFTTTCLTPLVFGKKIVYPYRLTSDDILDAMRKAEVTVLVGVPQLFILLEKHIKAGFTQLPLMQRVFIDMLINICWMIRYLSRINMAKGLLSGLHEKFGGHLRLVVSGGAKLDSFIERNFLKWGFNISQGYGLTETSPIISFSDSNPRKAGSVGRPLPGVVIKVINPDAKGIGEIYVKGPNVMIGYDKMPEETKKALDGGWLQTKDLGFIDKDGYLYVVGRKDEMLVLSSGENINPDELEKYYGSSEFIKEICILTARGIGYLETADFVVGIIVPESEMFKGKNDMEIEDKIKAEIEKLSLSLRDFKRIKKVIIRKEDLPKTSLGKIIRYKIRSEYFDKSIFKGSIKPKDISAEDRKLIESIAVREMLAYLGKKVNREVRLDDSLEVDLGIDSLGRMELLLELQKKFDIKIPEDKLEDFFYSHTVKELVLKSKPFLPKK